MFHQVASTQHRLDRNSGYPCRESRASAGMNSERTVERKHHQSGHYEFIAGYHGILLEWHMNGILYNEHWNIHIYNM